MKNFTIQLIVAAAISTSNSVMAQLPRECFFVTQMYGENSEGDLISNLPALETMYKPGMNIKSITSLFDSEEQDGRVTGLQLDLISQDRSRQLQLPTVGGRLDEWESKKTYFKTSQPDKISILTDTNLGGVCDVVIYQGNHPTYLSKESFNCIADEDGIEETIVRLPEETPLVGFHGRSDGDILESLGLILLNASDPVCQTPLSDGQIQMYRGSIFEQSEAAESAITKQEHVKTEALEAIIAYNTIAKARESKREIQKEIEALNKKYPSKSESVVPEKDQLYIESLKAKLSQFDKVEDESRDYLESEYDMQEEDIDNILQALKDDQDRLDQMQKILIDLEKHQQMLDGKDLSKDSAALSKLSLMVDANQSLQKQVRSDSENITNAEHQIEQESQQLVYVIMVVTFAAIILGMALGSCIVACCLKSYKNNQARRLEDAGHQNLRFVAGNQEIGMPTAAELKTTEAAEVHEPKSRQIDEDEESPAPAQAKEVDLDTNEVLAHEIIEVKALSEQKVRSNQTVMIPEPGLRTLADDDENDFVNVLTSRGIDYDAPAERRASIKAVAKSADKRSTRKIQSLQV